MFQPVKPIRTYGRKKEVIIPIPKLVISTSDNIENKNRVSSNKNINRIEKEEVDDNSLYDDPFETTFDKLFKNMRIPPPVHKAHNDTILLNSSDDKSTISDHKSSLCEVDDFNIKPVPKQKINHRKLKVQVIKKTMKKKMVVQDIRKFKLQKDNSHKYKLRETRNNSKMSSKYFEIDCLSCIYDEIKISEIKNHNQDKRKVCNKKSFVGKKKKGSNMPSVKSSNNMKVKPCFVNLDNHNISNWNTNAIENNLSKGTYHLSNQCINTNMNIDNLEHNNTGMKHCFIKLEQLEIDSYKKPLNCDKKNENVFNSTPNGRPIRSSVHLIPLSPIPIRHLKKLGNSNIHTNSALCHRNSEVCLGPKLISDDLCKRSNVVEKYELEDKSESLFNSLSNISNISKCNLNDSEKNSDILTELSCDTNVNYCNPNQKEFFTEKDSVQNNSKSGIRQSDMNKLILTQEHKIPNTKTSKYYLRFSVDTNKSRSLFDDTHENNTRVHNTEKKCNSNLVEDEKKTALINEMQSDFIKLDEKSTLNINYDKEVIFNKIEELPEAFIPIKLTTSHSCDDITIKLKTEEINNKSNEMVSDASCQILSDSESILNTNNSFVNSCTKYNVLPSYVVLEQLQDPIRVTKRKKYTKWDLDLVTIAEDCNDNTKQKEHFKKANTGRQMLLSQKKLSVFENIMEESTNGCITTKNPIYLKPGKSWARSLSILNNIQTEFNLDELSVGKGKKWRHSVQDILNMQTQGIIQSCIKKNDSDKKLQITNELTNKSNYELINNKGRTYDSTNLNRVSRRISIRVVPIHKTVKSIEDVSFLEVYGIVPIKSQRFTLINNSQKSSTCNIQNNDIDDQVIEEHIISTAREVILQRCLQKDYIPFSVYFSDLYLQHCRKIGEGVYGEVFLYEQENKKSVIKIIPIEGSNFVNGEPQKKFHEILSEIVIAKELHNLRFNTRYNTDGFVEVKNIKCIKGKYPEKLLELWNIYDEEKHSDNDCPSMFNDDQLYIVLELGHGGQDLEAFVFNTAEEAHTLFIQAALALAVAEKAIEFEHRDLHWGNILISPTDKAYVHYKFGQKNIELISKGVKVSIIDFTLSRVQYQGCSIFNDLASDPTLFTAQGEYQFEIYRLMKNKVKNNWQIFEPYTNILWLHYTLDKMITAVRYRKRNLKLHKNGIIKLKELKNEILRYNSAFDLITNCDKIVNLLHVNS